MNVHQDLEAIKMVAVHLAKEHSCNYNIIIQNPNTEGEFDIDCGSTYEYVGDSYFEKPRPNTVKLFTTDELIALEPQEDKPAKGSFEDVYPEYGLGRQLDAKFTINRGYEHADPIKAAKKHHSETIDYVSNIHTGEPYVRPEAKIGRNDACHCGSGKKLKKCCKE